MAKAPVRGEGGTAPPKKKNKPGAGMATPSEKKAGKKAQGAGNKRGNGVGKGGNKKNKKKKGAPKRPRTNRVLNPPFDGRMRKIGSPLNQAKELKRGWIIGVDSGDRINFLFNPSSLDLSAGVDAEITDPNMSPNTGDKMEAFYVATGMSTGVKLLFDRTYELFSETSQGETSPNAANKFGVFADVAAFFILLGMMEDLPSTWDDTFILSPPRMVLCYMFIGPRQVYYGWINEIRVAYSHWTQNMVPSRCAVDISFQLLPHLDPEGGALEDVPSTSTDYIARGRGWGSGELPERGGLPG